MFHSHRLVGRHTCAARRLGILVAVASLVAACGGSDDDDDATSPTSSDPSTETSEGVDNPESSDAGGGHEECLADQSGGEIAVGLRNEVLGFDPYVSGSTGSRSGVERMALFDALMRYDPETGTFQPRMAESLQPNRDYTRWTLTLRDGVTFGNGRSVTTDAVVFSVNRHRAENSTSLHKQAASLVESMEVVDERTMVFHLRSGWGNFPSLLAGPVGMLVDPATFNELGADGFAADPGGGGAGPFRLESWRSGEEVVLTARDDYWGGPVCIDTLRFTYGLDDTARYDAFQLGEMDVAFLRSPVEAAQAEEDDVRMHTQVSNGGYMVQINSGARGADRPGSDVRIRQAIAYALDPELINQRAFDGMGTPDTALVPDSSVLASSGLEGPAFDPDQARALLEEAKAEIGYDGSLHFLCNSTYEDVAIAITGLLEAIGFNVELDSAMSVQDWADRVIETDYDIACGSMLSTDAQPWAAMSQFISGIDSEASITGYESPDMVEAMNALKDAGTLEQRQSALAGVQEVWNADAPHAIYGHAAESMIWQHSIDGLVFTNELIPHFDHAYVAD